MIATALSVLTGVATFGYMLGDRADHQPVKATCKVIAASSFIGVALANNALSTVYGTIILAALAFSWCGDVALLWRKERVFLVGLFAFLLGHLAFAAAFVARGVQWSWTGAASVLMLIMLATAGRWFASKAPEKLRRPVIAYVTVIAAMVALAVGVWPSEGGGLIVAAALSFMVSDVFVGLDRFVKPGWQTRWGGTPLYFGAQVAFAHTVNG